jgi:phage-related protein
MDGIKQAVIDSGIADAMVDAFTNFGSILQTVWNDYLSPFIVWLSEQMPLIKEVVGRVLKYMGDQIRGTMTVLSPILAGVKKALDAFIANVFPALQSAFQAILPALMALWDAIYNLYNNVLVPVGTWIGQLIGVILPPLAAFLGGVLSVAFELWGAVVSTVFNTVAAIIDVFVAGFQVFSDHIGQIVDGIVSFFQGLFDKATEIWNGITEAIRTAITTARDVIKNIITAIKTTVTNIFNGIKRVVDTVWRGITNTIGGAVNGIRTTVSGVLHGVWSTVQSIFQGIYNAIAQPINAAYQAVSGAINAISQLIGGAKLELPSIALPHFWVKGGEFPWGIGGQGKMPSFGVDWYAKAMANGMLLDGATIFGMNSAGQLMGGGEAGKEWIVGQNSLYSMIQSAVASQQMPPINVVVNASEGMSEIELANRVARQIQQQVIAERAAWA